MKKQKAHVTRKSQQLIKQPIFYQDPGSSQLVQEEEQSQQEAWNNNQTNYITLKNKPNRTKVTKEENILQYFSSNKLNQYMENIGQKQHTINIKSQKQYSQLQFFVNLDKNICLFGVGSKSDIVKKIYNKVLSDCQLFVIKGYFPTVSIKKIFTQFGGFLIDLGVAFNIDSVTISQQIKQFRELMNGLHNRKIVIIMYSIDGPTLMNSQSQQRLSELFSLPNVQVLCTVDNINIVKCWSPTTLQNFKFLFFNFNTYKPYVEQVKSLPLKHNTKVSMQIRIQSVWQSLSRAQKQILQLIAKRELDNRNKVNQTQIPHFTFAQLLQACIEQIILSSDHQLRQNLIQLIDHDIVIQKNDDRKNKKNYIMNFDQLLLTTIMDMKID